MFRSLKQFLITIITISFITPILSAQQTFFKIEDFKPDKFVDLEWRVDGDFRLSGRDNNSSNKTSNNIYDISDRESNSSGYSLNLRNTVHYDNESIQQFLNCGFNFDGGFSSNSGDNYNFQQDLSITDILSSINSENKRRSYSLHLSPYMEVGKYFSDNLFLSSLLKVRLYYSRTPFNESERQSQRVRMISDDPIGQYREFISDRSDRFSDAGSTSRSQSINFEINPGWGHIYEGRYASTAIYIIDELRDNNCLIKELTKEEMIRLSEMIYKNRLQHAVDKRIRRIEIFDEILNYLKDINAIDVSNHTGYLVIGDIWDYFPNLRRRFGTRFKIGTGVDYRYSSRDNTDDFTEDLFEYHYRRDYDGTVTIIDTLRDENEINYRYYYTNSENNNFYLTATIEHFKPLTREWQLDLSGKVKYYFDSYYISNNYRHNSSISEIDTFSFITSNRTERDYSLNYDIQATAYLVRLINSRTSLRFNSSYNYRNIKYEDKRLPSSGPISISKEHSAEWRFQLGSNLTYRITIPTELILSANFNWRDKDSDTYDSRDFNYSINTTVRHYLF